MFCKNAEFAKLCQLCNTQSCHLDEGEITSRNSAIKIANLCGITLCDFSLRRNDTKWRYWLRRMDYHGNRNDTNVRQQRPDRFLKPVRSNDLEKLIRKEEWIKIHPYNMFCSCGTLHIIPEE